MSPLVLGKILNVFVNTWTADGKYPVEDWENLQLLIHMQILKNKRIFLNLFQFLESTSNFKHFDKKHDAHS